MSTLEQIVHTVDVMFDDAMVTPENFVNIIITESWTHDVSEVLTMAELTFDEKERLAYWVRTNWNSYSRLAQMAQDMLEIFPGLLFGTALEFCIIWFPKG